jgi:hypothetical protein
MTHWIGPANAEAGCRQAIAASERQNAVNEMRFTAVAFAAGWNFRNKKSLETSGPNRVK